jgi:hypothetical protein
MRLLFKPGGSQLVQSQHLYMNDIPTAIVRWRGKLPATPVNGHEKILDAGLGTPAMVVVQLINTTTITTISPYPESGGLADGSALNPSGSARSFIP